MQIGGQALFARTGNEQVAAILEHQLLQPSIRLALFVFLEKKVGRIGRGGGVEIHRHAAEEVLIILEVPFLQRGVTRGLRRIDPRCHLVVRELVGIEFFFGGILEHLGIEPVVRSRGDQQGDGIGLLDLDACIFRVGSYGAAFVNHLDLTLVVAVEMRNRSLEGQQIPLRRDRAGAIFRIEVGNLGAHGKRKRSLLIGGEPHSDHIVRVGGKILAFVSDPILLVGNERDGFIEVQ